MKRIIVFLVVAVLVTGSLTIAYAYEAGSPPMSQRKILVYVKPDVTVKVDGVQQSFRNSQGQAVYPLIYRGAAYLPIRASSALMKEPVEWDKASKTIFIGKTLSNPNKSMGIISTAAAVAVSESAILDMPKPTMESAYLKPDLLVMYDFVIQAFQDVNEETIYPIVYNGSAYLPIRSISKLMNAPIEWDGKTKTISIENATDDVYAVIEEDPEVVENKEKPATPAAVNAEKLNSLFEREEVLYYEATGHATAIKDAAAQADKELIATSITDNYHKAQALTLEIKGTDQTGFSEPERGALEKLTAYAESTEYYILVLENIAYLAAQSNDYSMLAETFLYFALDSQNKMEEARTAIQSLQ